MIRYAKDKAIFTHYRHKLFMCDVGNIYSSENGIRFCLHDVSPVEVSSLSVPSIPPDNDVLEQMEEGKAQVLAKYLTTALMPGMPLDRGGQPYQDLANLVRLRNSVVHLKPQKLSWTEEGVVIHFPVTKLIKEFERRKWTYTAKRPEITSISWLNSIQPPEIARWACRASACAVLNIADRFGTDDLLFRGWAYTRKDPRVGISTYVSPL